MNQRQFNILSAIQIPFALIIILWGAWVRISGSGDGCGVHWPLCQGSFFPTGEYTLMLQTWIEYFHRAKSGVFGILAFAQLYFAFRIFAKGSAVRVFAAGSFIFTVIEALLGALLVLGGFVDNDPSVGRILVMSAHLVNTLILLIFLLGTYFFSRKENSSLPSHLISAQIWNQKNLLLASSLLMLVAVTGAWASLSTTLFPSNSLAEGLAKDLASTSHIVLRLRMIHPLLAIATAFAVYFLSQNSQSETKNYTVSIFLVVQTLLGISTLTLLSPVWMKITHLLVADCLWLSLVYLIFRKSLR